MTSWGPHRLDLVHRGTGTQFLHKFWNGKEWKPSKDEWTTILDKVTCMHEPVVVPWGTNRLFVFVTDSGSWLRRISYDGENDKWDDEWATMENTYPYRPSAIAQYPHWIKVVVGEYSNQLVEFTYDGNTWSKANRLGGSFVDPPKLISWGPNRLDILATGMDRELRHKIWDGKTWGGWEDMGAKIIGQPNAVSWGPDRIDLFAIGPRGDMYRKFYDGYSWGEWDIDKSRIWVGIPEVVSWGSERIDLFLLGSDRKIQHRWYDEGGWQPADGPQRLDIKHVGDRVTAVCREKGHIDLFHINEYGKVCHNHYSQDMGWTPGGPSTDSLGGASTTRIGSSS